MRYRRQFSFNITQQGDSVQCLLSNRCQHYFAVYVTTGTNVCHGIEGNINLFKHGLGKNLKGVKSVFPCISNFSIPTPQDPIPIPRNINTCIYGISTNVKTLTK